MNDVKDKLLADAIKTAIDFNKVIIIQKRVIAVMSVAIMLLICGYFLR